MFIKELCPAIFHTCSLYSDASYVVHVHSLTVTFLHFCNLTVLGNMYKTLPREGAEGREDNNRPF